MTWIHLHARVGDEPRNVRITVLFAKRVESRTHTHTHTHVVFGQWSKNIYVVFRTWAGLQNTLLTAACATCRFDIYDSHGKRTRYYRFYWLRFVLTMLSRLHGSPPSQNHTYSFDDHHSAWNVSNGFCWYRLMTRISVFENYRRNPSAIQSNFYVIYPATEVSFIQPDEVLPDIYAVDYNTRWPWSLFKNHSGILFAKMYQQFFYRWYSFIIIFKKWPRGRTIH